MDRFARAIRTFVVEEEGAALVEYGILVALIAVVAIIVIATVGNKISQKFSEVSAKLG
jgi:pilus assembly protein Flp/PilA